METPFQQATLSLTRIFVARDQMILVPAPFWGLDDYLDDIGVIRIAGREANRIGKPFALLRGFRHLLYTRFLRES
jgi:hypothetical protein